VIKILIDMNLTPQWTGVFTSVGWVARHWSEVGKPGAADREIMDWARENGYIVFTHDLDFGAILAATRASGPSVIQVRAQDVLPETMGETVIKAIKTFHVDLEQGALISVDPQKSKARILPFQG